MEIQSSDEKYAALNAFRSIKFLRPLKSFKAIPGLRNILMILIIGLQDINEISIVFSFTLYFFSVSGLQAFKGLFLNRCYNVDMGYFVDYTTSIQRSGLCKFNSDCDYYSKVNNGLFICTKAVAINNPNGGATNFDDIYRSLIIIIQIITMQGGVDVFILLIQTFNFIHESVARIILIFWYNLVIIFGNLIIFTYLAVYKESFTKNQNNRETKENESNKRFIELFQNLDEEKKLHITKVKKISILRDLKRYPTIYNQEDFYYMKKQIKKQLKEIDEKEEREGAEGIELLKYENKLKEIKELMEQSSKEKKEILKQTIDEIVEKFVIEKRKEEIEKENVRENFKDIKVDDDEISTGKLLENGNHKMYVFSKEKKEDKVLRRKSKKSSNDILSSDRKRLYQTTPKTDFNENVYSDNEEESKNLVNDDRVDKEDYDILNTPKIHKSPSLNQNYIEAFKKTNDEKKIDLICQLELNEERTLSITNKYLYKDMRKIKKKRTPSVSKKHALNTYKHYEIENYIEKFNNQRSLEKNYTSDLEYKMYLYSLSKFTWEVIEDFEINKDQNLEIFQQKKPSYVLLLKLIILIKYHVYLFILI